MQGTFGYLGFSLKPVAQNCLIIEISFYRNIVCENVMCDEGVKLTQTVKKLTRELHNFLPKLVQKYNDKMPVLIFYCEFESKELKQLIWAQSYK